MKRLVVFYSMTGNTKRTAKAISKMLKCDVEEILDACGKRESLFGFMRSGFEAVSKQTPPIIGIGKDLSKYGLIIIGTPIWARNMASPVRTFITKNKSRFKKVAFFCTEGRDGGKNAFGEMEAICGKKPASTLELNKSELDDKLKINKFVERL